MRALIGLALLPFTANAGPYVELGIGSTFGACDCPRLDNPVGMVALGYQFANGMRLDIEHRSSLTRTDYGTNMASLKYRWEFGR